MIHKYTSLDNPLAQIVAAEEFCASVQAYIEDEYENVHGAKPPDVDAVHPINVLDALAVLGLRFELDGRDEGDDAYFAYKCEGGVLDRCLHAYARLVAEFFDENEFVVYPKRRSKKHRDTFELITFNGCLLDHLVFVPDWNGSSSAAYLLALSPGRLPDQPFPKTKESDAN